MKKSLLFILTAALLIACGNKNDLKNLLQKETVRYEDLRDVITQTGEVRPVVKVEIKCEASGKIDTLFVKEGEALKKGQRILKIDPTQLITQKNKLDLQVEKARLKLDLARRDYENAEKLAASGSVSQQKLQDLKSTYDLASLEIKDLELDLKDTEYELSKSLIVSPMDGVLISLLVEEGEIAVSATKGFSGGTAIGTVADVSQLEVVTQIGEADYTRIRAGQKVAIGLESNASVKAPGTVTFVSQSAKKETGSNVSFFEVRASVDSLAAGLVPGVNVSVDFVLMEKKHVLTVPYAMVEKIPGKSGDVYAVWRPRGTAVPDSLKPLPGGERALGGKKKFRQTPLSPAEKQIKKKRQAKQQGLDKLNLVRSLVRVGETDYRNYEVLSGLAEGDTVLKILLEKEE